MVEVQWQRVKDVEGCVQDLREEAIKIYPTNIFLLTKTGCAGAGCLNSGFPVGAIPKQRVF